MNTNPTPERPLGQKKRCAIYCRKSTDHGMDQQFTSIDAQVESCRAYIAAHAAEGWEAAGVYADVAVSGATLERPEMQRLRADVDLGLIDVVCTYKLDRISRSVRDFSNLVYEFESKGVSIVITTQNFDTSTPMGRMCITFLSSFAEFERSMTVERIRDKARAQARKGLWCGGTPPFGYRLGENRALLIDEPAASAVRLIFTQMAEGFTLVQMRDLLIRRNTPAPRGRAPESWSVADIRMILGRRLYAGKIVCAGVEHPGQHDALVSETLWEDAQRNAAPPRKYKRHGTAVVFPLHDLLYCPDCGAQLTNYYSYAGGKLHRYYRCPVHAKDANICAFSSFSAPSIELAAARHLSTLADDREVVDAIMARLPQLQRQDIRSALLDVEQLVSNLSDAALDTIFHALYQKITYDSQNSTLNFTRYTT